MDNDCIFQIPDHICKLLDIDWCEDGIKQYMVKEDGSLWLPWGYIFEGAAWDGIFREATSLIRGSSPSMRGMYRDKITLLINFHEDKFDYSQGRAES